MSTTTTTSKQFTLNLSDWWKGLIMAVGGAVFQYFYDAIINHSNWQFDWKAIGQTAMAAFIVYIGKNFFTKSAIVVKDAPKETIDAVKEGEAKVTITKQ
jgi:hypothetical protein